MDPFIHFLSEDSDSHEAAVSSTRHLFLKVKLSTSLQNTNAQTRDILTTLGTVRCQILLVRTSGSLTSQGKKAPEAAPSPRQRSKVWGWKEGVTLTCYWADVNQEVEGFNLVRSGKCL